MRSRKSVPLTVVMPVHNGGRHLAESLDSIAAQTFRDFELIVVDDGSTDDTAAILAEAASRDDRFIVVHQEHRGLTASLNRAIADAQGEYVARHDADDTSMPYRFERQVAYLHAHPTAGAVGTGAVVVDDGGREVRALPNLLGAHRVRDGLRAVKATPVHGSMMLRRSSFEAVGGYRPAFRAAQDFDLWLRLSETYDIDNLPDPVYRWRLHAEGVYATRRQMQLMYAGVAVVFAHERETRGADSYQLLDKCDGDLDRFSRQYRRRGLLEAWWGELLFRGLNNPRVARSHLRAAIREGYMRPRTLCLYGWSLFGFGWPGGGALQVSSVSPSVRP